jgi:radical SAM superfamily enzyme YgiQ (UPF0313 family)
MFGRRPRTKTPEQVGRELDAPRERGVRRVFFVDDNLIGDRPAHPSADEARTRLQSCPNPDDRYV